MRVLIVDDHTLVRAGIGRLLQALPDVDVVAEACNAQQALDLAAIHRPDLILLDLSLPDRSGLDLLPLLRESLPQTRVVIMSMHNDPTQVRVALDHTVDRGDLVAGRHEEQLEPASSPRVVLVGQLQLRGAADTTALAQVGGRRAVRAALDRLVDLARADLGAGRPLLPERVVAP